jgi:hypothetical protein
MAGEAELMNPIQSALLILFKKHRIVFWYDTKRELRAEYETLDLPEIEKIEPGNLVFFSKPAFELRRKIL